jgi:ribonuclease HI
MAPPTRITTSTSIVTQVCDLERRLHDPATRSDRAKLEQLLHPDYVEFSSNGRLWTRAAVLEALTTRPGLVAALNVLEMGGQQATPDTVIVTSVAQHGLRRSVRNSVWVLHDGAWRMRLHQATGIG